MGIRAITFDFWQTLFQDAEGAPRRAIRVNALVRATGVSEDRARETLDGVLEDFFRVHSTEQRTLTSMDAVSMACERLGLTVSAEVRQHLSEAFATAVLHHSPVPIADALTAVQEASARVPIGIISDSGISPGSSLRQLLDKHGFTNHFSVLTFSDEVGVAKPQAPMFERTAAALGVAPTDMLHIGDLEPTDIAGIQQLGGCAGLFTGVNARFRNTTKAEHVFNHWGDFLRRLPDLC